MTRKMENMPPFCLCLLRNCLVKPAKTKMKVDPNRRSFALKSKRTTLYRYGPRSVKSFYLAALVPSRIEMKPMYLRLDHNDLVSIAKAFFSSLLVSLSLTFLPLLFPKPQKINLNKNYDDMTSLSFFIKLIYLIKSIVLIFKLSKSYNS